MPETDKPIATDTKETPASSNTRAQAASRNRPLVVKGARVNNLKNIDISIPRNKLTVITGVSGSGKSSLAFDTIYAEGQRRYVESLSSYARQFLERMDKPDVDFIQGISPAMAIQQKNSTSNPRSTVGTTTEIYDYLRLMFARVGKTISPVSGRQVKKENPFTVIDHIYNHFEEGTKFYVLFGIPKRGRKVGEELEVLREKGFTRILTADESIIDLSRKEYKPQQIKRNAHRVLVDRLAVRDTKEVRSRMADSIETAFREGFGHCYIRIRDGEEMVFSDKFELDGMSFTEPTPQMFAFNNPYGACSTCEGFGRVTGIDEDRVIPDPDETIRGGAIAPFNSPRFSQHLRDLIQVCAREQLPIDTPYRELPADIKRILWRGKDEFIGIYRFFEGIKREFYKMHMRIFYARYRGYSRCPDCEGSRVRQDALYVKVGGLHIGEVSEMTIGHAKGFFEKLELSEQESSIASQILYEIQKRLKYLNDVGLEYLTLDRLTNTLSGGESQRISLSNALGSSLIGSLYVLDEPTIGLHPRDNTRLISILKRLRDIGNTVIVVEHDPEMMKAADHIIDIGPFAGSHGGEVVFSGPFEKLVASKTLTGRYLRNHDEIPLPENRRPARQYIKLKGATEHNLKSVDVDIPLGVITCITGVSGSGKSTLAHHTLYAGIQKEIGSYSGKVGRYKKLEGIHHIDRVEMVDQTPIGRSSRSNPATYTKAFDGIRELFASTRQAKIMGFKAGDFSFNKPGGRCEACEGEGIQTIEMQFLADIELPCEACGGKRYRKDLLQVEYRGKNIHDVLEMSISDAIEFFVDEAPITSKLQLMEDVGLGYLRLGQSGTTLSGGEAQRVKLARFLASKDKEHTLYFFDEPTTGLHFDDVNRLLKSFNRLIENGNSIIIIEHNMEIIKSADWVIDIGPEGGYGGGTIIAEGTPETLAKIEKSHTGKFLKALV
jgi:excinuclease ABC subunit A